MGETFNLDEIARLLEVLKQNDVTEFHLDRGESRLWLKRGQEPVVERAYYAPAPAQMPLTAEAAAPHAERKTAEPSAQALDALIQPRRDAEEASPAQPVKKPLREITSPMVGTFYRKPAVDAEPYVEVGDIVKKGDVLCIVEAMKLMNEIQSDASGRVAEICLEDAQMVEYGEVLFRIESL